MVRTVDDQATDVRCGVVAASRPLRKTPAPRPGPLDETVQRRAVGELFLVSAAKQSSGAANAIHDFYQLATPGLGCFASLAMTVIFATGWCPTLGMSMLYLYRSSVLLLVLDPAARPPLHPESGQPIDRAADRIAVLIGQLSDVGDKVIIPTPVLPACAASRASAGPATR
jgi:hypothetical protein